MRFISLIYREGGGSKLLRNTGTSYQNSWPQIPQICDLQRHGCLDPVWQRLMVLTNSVRTAHGEYRERMEKIAWTYISYTTALITMLIPTYSVWYTRVNKNPSACNFLSPKPEVTCGTVAIIIRVVLLSLFLRIRAVSLSSIHYNQSHRVYINRRRQYICLIWN